MRYRRHRMACSCPCVAHRGPRRPRGSNSSTATRPRSSATRTRGEATRARGDGQLNVSRAGHSETRIQMAGKSRSGGGRSPRRSCFTGHAFTGAAAVLLLRGGGPAQAGAAGGRSRARVGGGGAVPDGGFGGRERCPRFPASGGGDQLRETEIGRRVSGAK